MTDGNQAAWAHPGDPWLIFLDIDGTLVDSSHRPRPSAVRAVQEARSRGHRVFLSTGRSRSGISHEIMAIGFDGVVTASGGFIEVGDELIGTETMPEADTAYLIELFGSLGLEFSLQARDRTYASAGLASRMAPLLTVQRRLAAGEPSALAHLDQLEQRFVYDGPPPLNGIAKATFVGLDSLVFARLCNEVADRFLPVAGTIPYLGDLGGEIGLRDTNKGHALRQVARHYGIPMNRTMAVGDSANDLEMVLEARLGVAMGDAPEPLMRAAEFVTGTVAEDGIWRAFSRHGLVDVG